MIGQSPVRPSSLNPFSLVKAYSALIRKHFVIGKQLHRPAMFRHYLFRKPIHTSLILLKSLSTAFYLHSTLISPLWNQCSIFPRYSFYLTVRWIGLRNINNPYVISKSHISISFGGRAPERLSRGVMEIKMSGCFRWRHLRSDRRAGMQRSRSSARSAGVN